MIIFHSVYNSNPDLWHYSFRNAFFLCLPTSVLIWIFVCNTVNRHKLCVRVWSHVEIALCGFCLIQFCRFSGLPFARRRYRFRHGNTFDFEDQRGISRSNDAYVLSFSFTKSLWHSCRTLQCNTLGAPVDRKCRWMYGSRQRSTLRHLFQNIETQQSKL